jgi:hypothetical protein
VPTLADCGHIDTGRREPAQALEQPQVFGVEFAAIDKKKRKHMLVPFFSYQLTFCDRDFPDFGVQIP